MPLEISLDALLEQALASQSLRPLDAAFAQFLATHEPPGDIIAPLIGALVSQQVADGHLYLDLRALAAMCESLPAAWRAALHHLDLALIAADLQRSSVVSDRDNDGTPLVLDGSRAYLRRYWDHERFVAAALETRMHGPDDPPANLGAQLLQLFPGDHGPQWQRIACALAARQRFTVITGGPGTGKTTTVVRLLGLLQTLRLEQHPQPLRIRLAAPTGKAAARLNASIASQVNALPVEENVRAAIPTRVTTLHRLLGSRSDTRRFIHHAGHRLHLDILVIDEASMIDIELMSAVLAALPTSARLILLGDKDQLASVEAGALLGDLCARADEGHYAPATIDWLRHTTGDDIATWQRDDARALDQHIVMLRESHRFGADSGIGQLARHIHRDQPDAAMATLNAPLPDLHWLSSAQWDRLSLTDLVLDGNRGYGHYLGVLAQGRPSSDAPLETYTAWAEQVLGSFEAFQLLCAVRHGEQGTIALNQRIAEVLHTARLIDREHDWYEGRPVMINRNDYSLGLMNGDVGIALRVARADGSMALRVAFRVAGNDDRHSAIRLLPAARLGGYDTAFAITVHKSQGSEFDHAALVLPDEQSPVLSRELLYTAVTRARRRFTLCGPESAIRRAIAQPTRRDSALSQRIGQY
ncbi:exodeoxyribonuclease V subunit alpha [Dyella sp.]|uniref:exodeoxyribonuclease V subunit alpha n=1 Tax=Dyella sp. TaxID=1869338 RepID=UPI002ED60538